MRLEQATKNGDDKYWLSQEDIADIARIEYHNYKINDVFSEFEIIGSIRHFADALNKFKIDIRGQEKAHFTLIINLGNRHWVTLILFYQNRNNIYQAYYLDSKFDAKEGHTDEIISYKHALEKKFATLVWCDLSGFVTQQRDNYNCGFWALENAADINQMLIQDSRLLNWVIDRLNYPRDRDYFLERRKYFSGQLQADAERQARLQSTFVNTERSQLKKTGLDNRPVTAMASSVFERQYLKRPIALKEALPNLNAKKLKLDKSISLIEDNNIFIFIYMKMTFSVISNLIKNGKNWVTISDLCSYLLIETYQLTEENIETFLKEMAESLVEGTTKQADKKNIIKQLQNIDQIDKYLNAILYELDFNLCLMSLIHSSYLSILNKMDSEVFENKAESSYILRFLQHKQNFNIDLSLFSIYLTNDFTYFDKHLVRLLGKKSNDLEKIARNPLFKEEKEAVLKIKMVVDYLRQTPEVRNLSQHLVSACIANHQVDINTAFNLLKAFVARNLVKNVMPPYTTLFIFHAAFKALILNNKKIDLNIFFESFKEILLGNTLHELSHLFNKVSKISEIIYEEEGEEINDQNSSALINEEILLNYEVDALVKVLSPFRLLCLAGLSKKFEKETLDLIWNLYSMDLSGGNLFNELLDIAFIRNSVAILKWCQDKFDDQAIFIERMYDAWMSERDWGEGPYVNFLKEEKIKLVFELPEEEVKQYTAMLTWIKENTQVVQSDEIEFKRRELIFDFAVRTREKSAWLDALRHLLSCNQEKVKESYAYSRFAAEAVMKRDLSSLNEFWEEISQYEDELKITVQKRLLIDSTWAFHEAVRSGEQELIDFFLLKLRSLPEERGLGDFSYKYDLLRGLDPVQPAARNLITHAVISRNVEILSGLFDEIKKLTEKLENIVESEFARNEARQDIENKLTDLKRNYYLANNVENLNHPDLADQRIPDLIIAFYLAVKTNDKSMVQGLLKNVEDKMGEPTLKNLLLAVDEDKKTVMHWAVMVGSVEVQKTLLATLNKFGWATQVAFLFSQDTTRKTALHLAVLFHRREMLVNLFEVAARTDILNSLLLHKDIHGADLLRLAIINGDTDDVILLLRVIDLAFHEDQAVKERLFLKSENTYEAGVAIQENSLELAVRIGNQEIVKILLDTLENNFGLSVRNVYAREAEKRLLNSRFIQGSWAMGQDYSMMMRVLSGKCDLQASTAFSGKSSLRKKRNIGSEYCEFSWEEVDKFNEEKEKPRDLSALKVNSDRFLDYIASQSMSEKKRTQLIELIDTAQVTGTTSYRVSELVRHQKTFMHLNQVGKISGIAMQGMMAKNLLGDLIKEDGEGVVINLGFIASGQGFAKVAEIVNAKGLKSIFYGRYILGKSLRLGAPFLKRFTSAFVGYDLDNQIKEYKKGHAEALVGIVGDSIYLGIDVSEIGVKIAEVLGLLEEEISSIAEAVGIALGSLVFVGTDIYFSVEQVAVLDKRIHLTKLEKFIEGVMEFLHLPQQYIQTLVEEKQANNQLVTRALKLLEKNTRIKKYLFPSTTVIHSCTTHKPFCREKRIVAIQKRCGKEEQFCSVKQVLHKNNVMLLDEKKVKVKLGRARPDDVESGHFFCLPAEENGLLLENDMYYCENTMGIESLYNRTGSDVLIDLGAGNDTVIGFPKENHCIFVGDGYKNITLGEGNDTFILQGYPLGLLHGGSGTNVLDLGSYAWASPVVCVDSSKAYACHWNEQTVLNPLAFSGINTLLLRKNKPDWVWVDCNVHYIDARGGGASEADVIFIDPPNNLDCRYDMKLMVRPDTRISYCGGVGNFSYLIPSENTGAATILLLVTDNRARHEFIFNYTLYDIHAIKQDRMMINFDLVRAEDSTEINENKFLFSIFGDISAKNIFYKLSDQTEIKLGNNRFYALQSTDKPIERIIQDYPKIASQLKMYLFVTLPLRNETIAIGNGNYDVLYNNPYYKSHLIGNGGENIFRITAGYEILDKDHVPIPEIILYDVDEENLIDTLDLTEIRKQIEKDFALTIQAKINSEDKDLLINLGPTDQMEEIFVTVRLKDAWLTHWHKRLHIILNHVPMQVEGLSLKPLPLEFSQDKEIIVIFPEDIEEENELIIAKKSGDYHFARSGNNLVITNALDQNITTSAQRFTLLLISFYQVPKMETLSIKFTDKVIFIKNERQRIMNAPQLEDEITEYKRTGGQREFNAMTKLQRNRRFLSREKEAVSNLAINLVNPIGQVLGWLQEKSRQFVSSVIPAFYQSAPKISMPIHERPIFEQLEHRKSDEGKKNNRRFVRDDPGNHWIDSLYLLRYVLHYLGWRDFVHRVNQVENRLSDAPAETDPLDFVEQCVKKALANHEVLAGHDRIEQAVLDADRSRSAVTTQRSDHRARFFSQSSAQNDARIPVFAQNDSRLHVDPGFCPLLRGS